ncbi:MAG: XRE family transcriptional regulator [Marinicellaceae bacterium]
MKNSSNRAKILNQPAYWVENINAFLYDAILGYMEDNNLNQKQLAKHLGISAGRVSQILNDGEINFSIEKIVEIALKVGKFPNFKFEDKAGYLAKEEAQANTKTLAFNYADLSKQVMVVSPADQTKVIPLHQSSPSEPFLIAL